MDLFVLNAELRSDMGKGASRRLRREADKVPAIIYGGEQEPQPLVLEHNEVLQHVEHEAFYSHILTLVIDGKKQKAILKDMQRHPFKPKVTHMDFQRVSDKAIIHMQVPVHFINEESCVGVKAGGMIQHQMNTIEVVCAAKDLPEFIEVDVAALDVNDVIHLSDIKLAKGVQIADLLQGDDHDHAVVTVTRRGAADAADESEEEGGEE
ncbi:50S ribosomal protein L25/general stress protein Ctc [Pleionea litopenaei]|uniref:Large ribosomal subunit protein bL25 n=1 Tax=Pleionea litopenaei TaxID=3070815 RepID=A0AA51X6F3_9GAMM|nr:50S ribosomal protein L25/general stress protein Ctc [Pleionea sp. HL-JVS1]WMS87068.1 50S ribosomal protein L25/general stress protein Ctc [Pleionea sp. HL-JVS1]